MRCFHSMRSHLFPVPEPGHCRLVWNHLGQPETTKHCAQTGRSHVAVLVRPYPRRSQEDGSGTTDGAVRLTVRANSAGSEDGDVDPVESHSDPNDPWHQVWDVLKPRMVLCSFLGLKIVATYM